MSPTGAIVHFKAGEPMPAGYTEIKRPLSVREQRTLLIDKYAPCGCGSGKKFKFCCFREVASAVSALVLLCLLLLLGGNAQAQPLSGTNIDNPSAPAVASDSPPQTFFNSVSQYFTSSDPAIPFHGIAEVGIGMAYQSGVNFGSDFDLRGKYEISANGTNGTSWGIYGESVTRNAGVAGIIVSEQAGGGLYYDRYDLELSAGVLGGYRFDTAGPAFTAYADVRKNLTANTFAGTRLGLELDGRTQNNSPVITIYTGFEF